MFSWLQHLFTLRAILKENAALHALAEEQKTEINRQQKISDVKDEEIRSLQKRLNDCLHNPPRKMPESFEPEF